MAQFSGINLPTTGDPARDLLNYKIELERRLNHILRNIDITQIILGLSADKLVATNASGGLESVTALQDYIAGTTNRITVTDDLDGTITLNTPQDLHTDADVTFDSAILDDLTASRMVSTDANKKLVSISNLASWIAGTSNQVTITDDGDGSVTISLPQNINNGASPTFAGITLSGDNIKINTAKTPASAIDTGTTGTICWDSSYIYVCVSTNTWVRATLNTW